MSTVQQTDNNPTEQLLKQLFNFCMSDSISEEGVRRRVDELIQHGYEFEEEQYKNNQFLHAACLSEKVTEGIVRCLLDAFPGAAKIKDEIGQTALHCACYNGAASEGLRLPLHVALEDKQNVTLSIVQNLIDAQPDTVHQEKRRGYKPLHCLCSSRNRRREEDTLEILDFFIKNYPEQVRHVSDPDNNGFLPLHLAAGLGQKSPDFCRMLIDSYPESAYITTSPPQRMTPLHWACFRGTVATLKYIYKLYPDGNVSCKHGNPVHLAITRLDVSITQHEHLAILGSLQANDDPNIVAEIIKFLLDCDPNMAFQELNGVLPITKACILAKNSTLNTGLKVIKMLYDAYPNAVLHDEFLMTLGLRHEPNLTLIAQVVQEFISTQLTYARQSNNINFITRRDSKGQLPLHIALHDNYTLGAIKLFVKGHSTAIHTPDSSGALPLHIACQHHDSASVVDYLLGIDVCTLDSVDSEGNTPLHCACRGAKYDTIALLLEKYDAASVSERNVHRKLPIDLLWESEAVSDRESNEYLDSIFRLLRSNPEMMMMNCNMNVMNLQAGSDGVSSQNNKKRKFDDVGR